MSSTSCCKASRRAAELSVAATYMIKRLFVRIIFTRSCATRMFLPSHPSGMSTLALHHFPLPSPNMMISKIYTCTSAGTYRPVSPSFSVQLCLEAVCIYGRKGRRFCTMRTCGYSYLIDLFPLLPLHNHFSWYWVLMTLTGHDKVDMMD